MRVVCVGIDLDDLRFYRRIHALAEKPDTPLIFEVALPRFLEMCARLGVKATLFVIGEDMAWPQAREALRFALSRGHEVASHSYSHAYDLSKKPRDQVLAEVVKARMCLEDVSGAGVLGFRAPGYNLSDVLLWALHEAGYTYDSSLLPSPLYFFARAAVIVAMRAAGRKSASIVGRTKDFFGKRTPFLWPGLGLQEYPISACGLLGLPLIGTTLRNRVFEGILSSCAKKYDFVHVEFHALDFLDVREDSLDKDLLIEPALRVPLAQRLELFEDFLSKILSSHKNERLADLCVQANKSG